MFLVAELILLLTTNLILTQALGTSTLFIAAGGRKDLVRTAVTIFVFTTTGSAAAYIINSLLPAELGDIRLLLYTAAVDILYVIMLTVMYFISGEKFKSSRKYIHVSAFNCAVMGTLFTITDRAASVPAFNSFGSFVLAGAEAGVGFIIASLILTAAFRILNSKDVPASFRGAPAMLIYLGIISMAVYALS